MLRNRPRCLGEEPFAAAALGRREQNKVEKRGRIIAAARALFMHKGFEATTSQEIADAASVAAGTVFTYAKTKDDLLILVFHDEILEVVERAYDAALRERNSSIRSSSSSRPWWPTTSATCRWLVC